MKHFVRLVFWGIGWALAHSVQAQVALPTCLGTDVSKWHACRGVVDEPEFSYAGDFMRGKFEGRGILEFTADKFQGDYYQGEFKNGLKHGFGIYFFANGEKYAGQYVLGKRQGRGTYSFPDGRPALSGQWLNNQFVGKSPGNDTRSSAVSPLSADADMEKKKTDALSASRSAKPLDKGGDPTSLRTAVPPRDAVALVIGIANYQRLPPASFANKDASQFREHAIRHLGVPPENVKTMTDAEALRSEIWLALKYWLPSRVNAGKTDVFVYFSGHGVSNESTHQAYLMPVDANTDLLDETALNQPQLLAQLSKVGAKSVTVFLDACFSGTDRMGQALAPFQRGVVLKANQSPMPRGVNVLSAGGRHQSAYGDLQLQQGIFSHYLFKGLSGEANRNADKHITLGELVDYVQSQTQKHALGIRKLQEPQFVGDRTLSLVSR